MQVGGLSAEVSFLPTEPNSFLTMYSQHPRDCLIFLSMQPQHCHKVNSGKSPATGGGGLQVACFCCLDLSAPSFLCRAMCFLEAKNYSLASTRSSLWRARVCKSGNCVTLVCRPGTLGSRPQGDGTRVASPSSRLWMHEATDTQARKKCGDL